jgi:hypothetical protein
MDMRVLVVESHLGASERLKGELDRRGHQVLTCHADDHERHGCRAVDRHDGCPLDQGAVDVTVDVRRSYHPDPRPLEQGAICAVRARVPLVVAGTPSDSPLEPWANAVVLGDVPAIVDAVEGVDGSLAPVHQQVVDEALDVLLPGEGATAIVRRGPDQLAVDLSLPSHLSHTESEMVAVRIVAAVRRFDQATSTIDVAVVPPMHVARR